jgi:hypothetical protein
MTEAFRRCYDCGEECKLTTLPTLEVTWGKNGRGEYGEQKFTIENDVLYKCTTPGCEGGYYTFEQAQAHEKKINEWLKLNLGYDWLKANAERRARWKAEGNPSGRKRHE